MEVFETKAEFSSYSKPAWVFAICAFSIVVPLGVYVNFFDHNIGSAVFSLSYWLGSALGIGHKVAFLLLAIYVPALLCVASCLSQLVPLFVYRRNIGSPVFFTSGFIWVLLYTWSVIQERFSFLAVYMLHSVGWQYRNVMDWLTYAGATKAFALENSYLAPIGLCMVVNLIGLYVIAFYAQCEIYEVPKSAFVKRSEMLRRLFEEEKERRRRQEQDRVDGVLKQHPACLLARDDSDNELFASLTACLIGYVFVTVYDIKNLYNDLAGFSPAKVAQFTGDDVSRISQSPSHLRSKYRIRTIINNAQAFVEVQRQYGSFANYLRKIIGNCGTPDLDDDENRKKVAKRLVKDLHKRGFKYIGVVTASFFLHGNHRILGMQPSLPLQAII